MKVNKYFDDNVFSIGFDSKDGAVSSGVMAPGEYTFGTSQKEKMVVVHGTMSVKYLVKTHGKKLSKVTHFTWKLASSLM